jgi:hypothetical protein
MGGTNIEDRCRKRECSDEGRDDEAASNEGAAIYFLIHSMTLSIVVTVAGNEPNVRIFTEI